ncbi:unnamed protein product, partial [Bubo scandiacus]
YREKLGAARGCRHVPSYGSNRSYWLLAFAAFLRARARDCHPLQLLPSSWVLRVTFPQLYSTSILHLPSFPSLSYSVAS